MSVSVKTRQAYSEIDEFLGLLTVEEQNQIPKKLREFFKKEKDSNYVKNINPNIPIKEQNLLEETLAIIALLNLQYWCKDEHEKERLKRIYINNENKYQSELREKYNLETMFKKKENEKVNVRDDTLNNNEQQMVVYKESAFKKFFAKIFKFFNLK